MKLQGVDPIMIVVSLIIIIKKNKTLLLVSCEDLQLQVYQT